MKKKPIKPVPKWYTIFQKNSGGLSSKRILSVLGILTCIIIFVAAFILQKDVPEFGETLLICMISLYGIDKVPTFWTKNISKS